jgi:O-antigen biosynthesis rhamnosyltransferase
VEIIHIFKQYFPEKQGGVEETIRQICRFTAKHGVKNKILTVSPTATPDVIAYPEATVTRYKTTLDKCSTPISFDFFANFKEHISSADILHFHFPWPFAELCFLCNLVRKPALVTYHSDIVKHKYLNKLYRPFSKLFLRKVDTIIATSENYLQSSNDLRPYRSKCRVIHLTIDRERLGEADRGVLNVVRSEYGEDFFLFVGVLRLYKGLDYLLEAMKGLKRKLVIVGKGPEEVKLKAKAKALGLGNVAFAGYIEDKVLPAFYKLSRGFVFPSCDRSEAFGISLLEASYFSKPMISTELGTGTTLVNRHKETGLVVAPRNVIELRDSLTFFSKNKQICEKYGRNAKKRFEKLFSSEAIGMKYLDTYNQLYEKQNMMRE